MFPVLSSKAVDSIRRIQNRIKALTSTYSYVFDTCGTLRARAHQGLRASRLRLACSVVLAIGITLFIPMSTASNGSILAIQSLREIAEYHLPIKQEACHNEIVHRESSWRAHVRNGSHVGYYQGRSKYLINKPDDVQFYWYWHYVANRYGIDDEVPNYCNALNHLKRKGWQ